MSMLKGGRGWRRLWLLLLLPAALGLNLAARYVSGFAEWYAIHIYRYVAGAMGTVSGAVPFSLTEFFYAGAAVFIVWVLVRAARRSRRAKGGAVSELLSALATLGATGSVLIFIFAATFGVNYYRYSFSAYCGLEIRESSTAELKSLCAELINDANRLSYGVSHSAEGVMVLNEGDFDAAVSARDGYDRLGEKYPVLKLGGRTFGTPKPMLISPLMSYTQISGVSFPFTMEANVNVDGPDFLIPATMMHEQTHLAGFMREDEANFTAFLACRGSDDPEFMYSGVMLALIHSMNALYSADPEGFSQLRSFYNSYVDADMRAQNAHLSAHEGKIAEVSSSVNDAYLKANSQADGVKSYGRMVDLLLADYRARRNG